jgi:hypothetical protein
MCANLFRPSESFGQQPVLTASPIPLVTALHPPVKNCSAQVLRMSDTAAE